MKPTALGSLLYHICLRDLFLFAFIFRSIKPKIQNYLAALYFICDLFIQSITTLPRLRANFWRRYPKGNDNPFNTSGCEVLLFVCRCCLRCVAWFSYWFDNLGFTSKGNTYRRYAASSLPLWGNTDVVQANIKRNLWRRCRGYIININQVPNHTFMSSQFTLFAICVSFPLPHFTKFCCFICPLFLSPFSRQICLCAILFV